MKFLVDAQLPRRLGHRLRECGHDAAHTLDLPLGNRTSDAEIMRIADTEGRVVITKGNRSPPSPACGRGAEGEGFGFMLPIRLTTTSRLIKGRPRQFWVM